MEENPWLVESLQAFTFLKCPECIFDSKEEYTFQDHAIENHPLSFVLFGKTFKEEEEIHDTCTLENHIETDDMIENTIVDSLKINEYNDKFSQSIEARDVRNEQVPVSSIENISDIKPALLFPSIPFHFFPHFSKNRRVEGNSNFEIAISFHFCINFKNCYFLPF